MIGCSMPNISVIAVFIYLSPISPAAASPENLPLLAEWPDFVLKGPGIARLLIELPIGRRDRGGPHQAVRIEIFHRLWSFPAHDQLPYPFGIDAGVDDQMRDMDALGAKLARHRLRHR